MLVLLPAAADAGADGQKAWANDAAAWLGGLHGGSGAGLLPPGSAFRLLSTFQARQLPSSLDSYSMPGRQLMAQLAAVWRQRLAPAEPSGGSLRPTCQNQSRIPSSNVVYDDDIGCGSAEPPAGCRIPGPGLAGAGAIAVGLR